MPAWFAALHPNAFGELETAVLNILGAQSSPMTVRQVRDALPRRGLADTTILTTMVRVRNKGWLDRTARHGEPRRGRGHTDSYTAVITEGALLAAAIEETCAAGRRSW